MLINNNNVTLLNQLITKFFGLEVYIKLKDNCTDFYFIANFKMSLKLLKKDNFII